MEGSDRVDERAQRLGSALHRMARDLVSARRRLAALEHENRRLERENRDLKAQLQSLGFRRPPGRGDQPDGGLITGSARASSAKQQK